eukprot:366203-Chlamydomonas_euryale.AAC.22
MDSIEHFYRALYVIMQPKSYQRFPRRESTPCVREKPSRSVVAPAERNGTPSCVPSVAHGAASQHLQQLAMRGSLITCTRLLVQVHMWCRMNLDTLV